MKPLFAGLLWAAATSFSLPALSADAITDAMQAAYAPYRAALFRTNGKSQEDAEKAMAQAQSAWQALSRQYATQPPPPYDRDPKFADSLVQVSAVYEHAAGEIRVNQLPAAHESLETVRDLLSDLRRRNNVLLFSDAMNAYHAEMEHVLGDGAKALGTDAAWMALAARVGVLDYLAGRLRSDAPAAMLGNADFETQLKSVQDSVTALRNATMARDEADVREAIGKLKGPYSRMFLNYG